VVFRDGDEVEIGSRSEKPLTRYFPELVDALRANLPPRCVVDGEIVVVGEHGLDWDALGQRIHPADSRVQKLAVETPASFVAFDLLALGDRSLLDEPFSTRRGELTDRLGGVEPPIHVTPATDDAAQATDWFERFEGAGLDGVVAKRGTDVYEPGRRTLVKVKHQRTGDMVVAGFRWHKDGETVGSLLLGVYDSEGRLQSLGVASGFSAKQRAGLVDELRPLTEGGADGHPWVTEEAGDEAAGDGTRLPGAPSRWSGGRDTSWVPLRIERVAEVEFSQLQGDALERWGPPPRLRHPAHLLRWRPDREPESCRFDQLVVTPPLELSEVFAAGR
jgi:ATP-dependent DNA ligase